MKKNQIIIVVVVILLVGGLSFYAGTKVGGGSAGAGRSAQFAGGANGGARAGRGAGGAGGAGFTTGEVISKDATSITVKLRDGGSKIIFVTPSTVVQKAATGTISDVVVGSQITANGASNADGSLNATMISSRPAMPQSGAQGAPQGQVQTQ